MKSMLTWFCFSLALVVGLSPAFAAKKVRHSAARAQAPIVVSYPAPAPVDLLYAACRDMSITFPACPGH
jgi:hypothetical protein